MPTITVLKLDINENVTWRYHGKLLLLQDNKLILEAYFDREDTIFHGMPLRTGDRFIETYFTDRWYNIFEVHARENDHLRGWYCNIGRPIKLEGNTLSYVDLALDLLVFPDGSLFVLDEDEYNQLDLSPNDRNQARMALLELQDRFRNPDEMVVKLEL